MTDLKSKTCEACRADAPLATPAQIKEYLAQLPEWKVIEIDGIKQLQRVFKFQDFKEALAFSNRVGDIAEAEGHHPAILTEWGRTTVNWWTHKIKGLHVNDFVMAAKTDLLLI
jgi:4a-hydroxytetrahydrobiopterin dehydratase